MKYLDKDIKNLYISNINTSVLYCDYNLNQRDYINSLNKGYRHLKNEINLSIDAKRYLDKCFYKALNTIVTHTKNKNLEVLLGQIESKEIHYISNSKMSNKT